MPKSKSHQERQDVALAPVWPDPPVETVGQEVRTITGKFYREELAPLQIELVKLQEWVKHKGLKVVIVFEGRDAAGKGGTIKRITEPLNPRVVRVAAEQHRGEHLFDDGHVGRSADQQDLRDILLLDLPFHQHLVDEMDVVQ